MLAFGTAIFMELLVGDSINTLRLALRCDSKDVPSLLCNPNVSNWVNEDAGSVPEASRKLGEELRCGFLMPGYSKAAVPVTPQEVDRAIRPGR
jgi:hypothetical protein